MLNRLGDNTPPCPMPLRILSVSENIVLHLTTVLSLLYQFITRSSADADKPARHIYTGYGFLLVLYRNFVRNTHRF